MTRRWLHWAPASTGLAASAPEECPFMVAFPAHPADEPAHRGTMALLAGSGHRAVLVTATDEERGLVGAGNGTGGWLAAVRAELHTTRQVLGCARTGTLGFPDWGLRAGPGETEVFSWPDPEEPVQRLASLLTEEAVGLEWFIQRSRRAASRFGDVLPCVRGTRGHHRCPA